MATFDLKEATSALGAQVTSVEHLQIEDSMLYRAIVGRRSLLKFLTTGKAPKHRAAPSITEMADRGVMTGVGNSIFAPDKPLTYAEFITMAVRQCYPDKIIDTESSKMADYIITGREIMTGKKERDFNDPDITLGMTDDEMTERFRKAVELAIMKTQAMGLPVQKYDADRKQPYLEYPDGRREYV